MKGNDGEPYGMRLEIGGTDVTNLLRSRSALFQKIDPDPTLEIVVSAEQFQLIADAHQEARQRSGDGGYDKQYFKSALEKILSEDDLHLLEHATARLVVAEL